MNIWSRRFFWLFAAYTLQRALFFAINYQTLDQIPALILLQALWEGVRFDLCVIATVNVPLLAAHLSGESVATHLNLDRYRTRLSDLISLVFLLVNIPLIVFGIVDSQLFAFTGRRISLETFAIGGDIKSQSLSILIQYWPLTLSGLMFLGLFAWQTIQRRSETFSLDFPTRRRTIINFWIFAAASFLAIRGGWQTKPLAPAHAYQWQPAPLANFVLNSGITLLRSPSSRAPRKFNDFKDMNEIRQIVMGEPRSEATIPLAQGKNFIIIIVESLGSEYTGFSGGGTTYTPFLDSLSKNSITFRDSFANGRRSIDAMPAIFAGIPAWRTEPFVTSPYATNTIHPLPRLLASAGYHTMFFHGAANGSMHFDVFAKLAGFDEYIGRNEYPYKGDDDGQWGIYDAPFLKYAIEKFSRTPQPFLAGIFTLTSHNPFKVPPSEAGKYPKGTLPIHESIGYVDHALSSFFKLASREPWFHNSIFVITGDHTSLSDQNQYNNMPGRFRVPIMFFDPSGTLPQLESSKVASHVDILPTILELAGVRHPSTNLFGGPLFDRNWPGRFVQEEYETWYYRDKSTQVVIEPAGATRFYRIDDDAWTNPPDHSADQDLAERELKALRQYFVNGMIENSWF